MKNITLEQAKNKWPHMLWDDILTLQSGYNQAIDDCNAAMEAKLIHDVCPKCGNADVIWTCYCNECKEAH